MSITGLIAIALPGFNARETDRITVVTKVMPII